MIHCYTIDYIEDDPLLYYRELCDLINFKFGTTYTVAQMQAALDKEGYTEKKLDLRALVQSQPLRSVFMAALSRYSIDQLLFIDETHANPEDLRRQYGKAIHGQPAFMYMPGVAHGQSAPVSGICAMPCDTIKVAHVAEGNVDGNLFMRVLEEEILPKMNPFPLPKSVLVLDNAAVHNANEIYSACQKKGVLVHFLPPYSYDYNPLELAFHYAKQCISHGISRTSS